MDFHRIEFRDTEKLYLLSIRSQYYLVKIIRFFSFILFNLSFFVIIWLFLFAFYQHPDLIICKTAENVFYPKLNELNSWSMSNFYGFVQKDNQTYLNQTIKCTSLRLDLWSCIESYLYDKNSVNRVNILKENMNYFELTEYLNNNQKKAFGHNHILNCEIHFKNIDRLFNCWIHFTCEYKLFIILHSILFELGMNWFICTTLKKDFILNQNSFLNFQVSLVRNFKVMNILRYCTCLLILLNGFCYFLYGILPLALPFAYFIINVLKADRIYVEYVNLAIISTKYLIFLLKSTKFFVTE